MPLFNRSSATMRADPHQNGGAHEIADKSEDAAGDNKKDAAPQVERVKFAEEKRDHQRRLQRADAAAGLFDSDKARANLDDIAVLKCGSTSDVQHENINCRNRAHETLRDNLFCLHRPGHGHKKKQKRESEMTK